MLLPDLPTLLLVRLGVDVLIAGTFLGLMRRYPAIGGPGWWTLGALIGLAASMALMLRAGGAGPLLAAASAVLLLGSNACTWLGLRSYLRMPMPWRVMAWLMGLHAVLHLGLALSGNWPRAHHLGYSLAGFVLTVLTLRDLLGPGPQRSTREFRPLILLTGVEAVAVASIIGWLAMHEQTLGGISASFLLVFLLTKILRALIFSALIALRLRQDVERARQSMAEREADSRALITHLGAGVVVFRPDRSVLLANRAARGFFGWPIAAPDPTECTRATAWRLVREDGTRMRRHEVPFERVLATGQAVSGLVGGFIASGDDTVRWALSNAYPENDAAGGLRHVVLTFVDITLLKQSQQQQQRLEQQLAQSQKMEALGTLAGGVAHDFNNILAAVLGNADLASQDMEPDSPARESLREISNAARRGRELVRQILAFSRQQPLARTPVDLHEIVSETCGLLRTALTPQIQLAVTAAVTAPFVRADATQLGQVLLNLGTNAIHALGGRPGRIEYRVEVLLRSDPRVPDDVAHSCAATDMDAVCVSVSDDGCGMSEATRKRMFEPFFTTKPVGQGTGLGLPVVLGIVQAHGGAIEVDSTPGAGTRFTLYFPATVVPVAQLPGGGSSAPGTIPATVTPADARKAAAPEEFTQMADDSTTDVPRHILYLDDDDTLVFLVRRLLERRGYEISTYTDQEQAIDAVRNRPQAFDLLMTDFNMPGMSGLDVARAVLAINPSLPVALASGYITDELQSEAHAAGVREVVFKTDAVEAFCEVVARLVTPPRRA